MYNIFDICLVDDLVGFSHCLNWELKLSHCDNQLIDEDSVQWMMLKFVVSRKLVTTIPPMLETRPQNFILRNRIFLTLDFLSCQICLVLLITRNIATVEKQKSWERAVQCACIDRPPSRWSLTTTRWYVATISSGVKGTKRLKPNNGANFQSRPSNCYRRAVDFVRQEARTKSTSVIIWWSRLEISSVVGL
jgi:hypothetical protein